MSISLACLSYDALVDYVLKNGKYTQYYVKGGKKEYIDHLPYNQLLSIAKGIEDKMNPKKKEVIEVHVHVHIDSVVAPAVGEQISMFTDQQILNMWGCSEAFRILGR